MVAKPLRTKPKSASAERCLRALGATIAMATPDMETSNWACEGCIVAWRFTKRQPGGRGDYWGLSLSGNCWLEVTLRFPLPPPAYEGGRSAAIMRRAASDEVGCGGNIDVGPRKVSP